MLRRWVCHPPRGRQSFSVGQTESKFIEAVSNGWPILASLKSLLETGEPLEETRRWPKGL
jgi:hypothetical protein